ncbi:MAG: hypothetical protein DELT_02868 [Desulfovibrio sp.]
MIRILLLVVFLALAVPYAVLAAAPGIGSQ